MADPIPKHPAQRRRRNAAPVMVSLPAEGSGREAPPLPDSERMLEWTLDYWQMLWASPMAVLWKDADVPALIRMARLQDTAMRDKASAGELSEIRQLEDRYGLSPLARRRLQWEITQEGEKQRAARRPRTRTVAATRKLRAV